MIHQIVAHGFRQDLEQQRNTVLVQYDLVSYRTPIISSPSTIQ